MTSDRYSKLFEIAQGADKADLALAHNGLNGARNAYNANPGKITKADLDAARELYEETEERLWPKYFPGETDRAGGEAAWFRDKSTAHEWYITQGGILTYSGFTRQAFTVDGRKVSRISVQKLLLDERKKKSTADSSQGDTASRKEEADLRRAEAEARIKERQDEREQRELDREWVRRELADEETCVWVSRLRDACVYHLGKASLALIYACGGDPGRIAEVQGIIDGAISTAANEIADSPEITVTIEDIEDEAC